MRADWIIGIVFDKQTFKVLTIYPATKLSIRSARELGQGWEERRYNPLAADSNIKLARRPATNNLKYRSLVG